MAEFNRQTAQCTGYKTKTSVIIHQVSRAQAPQVVTEDERSTIYDCYDHAMINLMGEIFTQTRVSADGLSVLREPLKRTFATPDRAFAAMARQMDVGLREVPLPFGSLMRPAEAVYDGARDNRHMVNTGLSYDSRDVEMHEWPYPQNIPYTFTIWCRTMNDADSFKEQCIMGGWYQELLYIKVNHPRRVGDLVVPVDWTGTDQQDEQEPGADRNRLIQRVFNFTVLGWVPRRAVDRRAVLKGVLEKYAVRQTTDLNNVQESDIVERYGTDVLFEEEP